MKGGNQINRKGLKALKRKRKAAGLAQFRHQVVTKMKAVLASGDYRKSA